MSDTVRNSECVLIGEIRRICPFAGPRNYALKARYSPRRKVRARPGGWGNRISVQRAGAMGTVPPATSAGCWQLVWMALQWANLADRERRFELGGGIPKSVRWPTRPLERAPSVKKSGPSLRLVDFRSTGRTTSAKHRRKYTPPH